MRTVSVGEVREHRGQAYICERLEPYVNRSGVETRLAVWASGCAQCGAAFEFRTRLMLDKFEPNKRCVLHRQPGVRARGKPRPPAPSVLD